MSHDVEALSGSVTGPVWRCAICGHEGEAWSSRLAYWALVLHVEAHGWPA